MKELETPHADQPADVRRLHMPKKLGQISRASGHKIWTVNKSTEEVQELKTTVSTLIDRPIGNGATIKEMHHKAEGSPDFFYTSALNKKNALRHWRASNEFKYRQQVKRLQDIAAESKAAQTSAASPES